MRNSRHPSGTRRGRGGRGGLGSAALAACIGLAATAHGEIRVGAVLKTGDPAPGVGPGLTWVGFFPGGTDAIIDQQGRIALVGSVAGTGVTPSNGIVLVTGPTGATSVGPLRLVARQGDAAPGAGAGVTFALFLPVLLADGRLAFAVNLLGTGVTTANDNAWYIELPGGSPGSAGLGLVLREGGSIAGLPGVTIAPNGVGLPYFAADGSWAAAVTITGPGVTTANDSVLLRASSVSPLNPVVLAREGDAVPGQVGINYGPFGDPQLTTNGRLVVRSQFVGASAPLPTTSDEVIFEFPSGTTTPTWSVREGDAIPGQASPAVWGRLFTSYVTRGDQLAVYAQNAGVTPQSLTTWIGPTVGTPGSFRALGQAGTAAPGFPAGAVFGNGFIGKFDANNAGQAAFIATTSGGGVTTANDNGAFRESGGVPVLAAREADVPPGLASPAVFGPLTGLSGAAAINARQQAAFWLYAPNPTTDVFSDSGLWVVGADGQTRLVAHKRAPFTLGPGDARPISIPGNRIIVGPQPPSRTWFSDAGRLVLTLGFADTTGALVLLDIDPPPTCVADFNDVGGVTVQDIFDFLTAWFANDPAADVNNAGGVGVQDIFDFLTAWFGGC